MKKGEETRRRIVEAAARLINERGFSGMSMSDLMERTGLEKGGLYRHFDSKETIAAAAFEFYQDAVEKRLQQAMSPLDSPRDRLLAMVRTLGAVGWEPIVQGGCMVMNLAIECDYADLPFRSVARGVVAKWRKLIRRETKAAIRAGEFPADTDAEALASVIISAIEGAIMLSGIESNPAHARRVVRHLESLLSRRNP